MTQMSYDISLVGLGWIGVIVGANGLLCSSLPRPTKSEVVRILSDFALERQIKIEKTPKLCVDCMHQLTGYYLGERREFTIRLDFDGYSDFEKRIWKCSIDIPYGETRSYGWIARTIQSGRAARAVGNALGKNPFAPIVPCHRVVRANGGLGGFGGGLGLKRKLLELEQLTD